MGAFKDFKPMKVFAFKYDNTRFLPFNDYLDPMRFTILLCSNWVNYADVYEFEGVYDPKYLNLEPGDKNNWRIYAGKVRDIISKVANLRKTPFSLEQWNSFEKVYMKELRKC